MFQVNKIQFESTDRIGGLEWIAIEVAPNPSSLA